MFLEEIQIKNFRSISDLSLKISDNIICLIGKNESGKSNILKAINFLNYKRNRLTNALTSNTVRNRATVFPTLRAFFRLTGSEDGLKEYLTAKGLDTNILEGYLTVRGIELTISGPALSDVELRIHLDKGKYNVIKVDPTDLEGDMVVNDLLDFLPNIEYFEKEEFTIKPLDQTTLLNNSQEPSSQAFKRLLALGGVEDFSILAKGEPQEINELKDEIADRINSILRKYYKQNENLVIKVDSHNGVYTLHFKDEFKKLNSLEDRSTGFQYFFSFLINKIYLKEFTGKSTIFLLDEPALVLHPTGQKDFIKLLDELAIENQIIYTTHSPFSINRLQPNRVLTVSKTEAKGTFIETKPYLHNWRSLRTSLGIDISDSFFYADKTLLVEGPEDKIYFSALINFFAKQGIVDLNTDIFSILDAGSASNFPAMVQILLDEERPMVVLIDSDVKTEFNRIKRKETDLKNSSMLKVIQVNELKKDALAIEDLLPIKLYEQASINYLKMLVSEKIFQGKQDQTPSLVLKEGSKIYEQVASYIIENYNQVEGELNKKVPISKVGIANEFDKLLKEGTSDKAKIQSDYNTAIDLIKKVGGYLKVFATR